MQISTTCMEIEKLRELAKLCKNTKNKLGEAMQNVEVSNSKQVVNLLGLKLADIAARLALESYILYYANINTANHFETCTLYLLACKFQQVAIKEQQRDRSEYVKEYSSGGNRYKNVNFRKAATHPPLIYYKNGARVTIDADKAREWHEAAKKALYDYILSDEFTD